MAFTRVYADRFCFLLYQVLINAKILHQSERINIRPIRLLEEASCCKEAIELIRSFPLTTVSMQGVCCAASAVIEHRQVDTRGRWQPYWSKILNPNWWYFAALHLRRHSCILTCNGCGEEAVVPEGKNPPSCCGSFIHKTEEPRIITCKVSRGSCRLFLSHHILNSQFKYLSRTSSDQLLIFQSCSSGLLTIWTG